MPMRFPAAGSMKKASIEGKAPRDVSTIDWLKYRADPREEDALAYSFYALLDDAGLREVFGDLTVSTHASE